MKQQARKTLVTIFCEANRLNLSVIAPSAEVVIANVEAPFLLFVELLKPSRLVDSADPVDGLLITLVRRLHDTVSGALALLAIGRFQQAEILSRTVMESSLSVQYILAEHSGHRLVQYFQQYVKDEREQNRKWQKDIEDSPAPLREDHRRRIKDKEKALVGYEAFIQKFAGTLPALSTEVTAWPRMYDISSALGKAVDYRTVYMAMCSQAHHDAEDILNDFMVGSSGQFGSHREQLERETDSFSVYLLLCSIHYYLECLSQIGKRYGFLSVETQASNSRDVIVELAEKVAVNDFINPELNGFLAKRI